MKRAPTPSRRPRRRFTLAAGGSGASCAGPARCASPRSLSMKRILAGTFALAALLAGPAGAQGGGAGLQGCTVTGNAAAQGFVQDACQQAVDVFGFMAPQLGLALTGGNHTLGQNSTLGGFPHFSVGLRGTAFKGNVPRVDQFSQ